MQVHRSGMIVIGMPDALMQMSQLWCGRHPLKLYVAEHQLLFHTAEV